MQEGVLTRYAILYGKAERSLFAAIQSGKDPVRLKASFMKTFGITARQFNAIRMHLQGKIASVTALQPVHVEQLRTKIVKAKKGIKRLQEEAPGSDKLHQKKRRLHALELKLEAIREQENTLVASAARISSMHNLTSGKMAIMTTTNGWMHGRKPVLRNVSS